MKYGRNSFTSSNRKSVHFVINLPILINHEFYMVLRENINFVIDMVFLNQIYRILKPYESEDNIVFSSQSINQFNNQSEVGE